MHTLRSVEKIYIHALLEVENFDFQKSIIELFFSFFNPQEWYKPYLCGLKLKPYLYGYVVTCAGDLFERQIL